MPETREYTVYTLAELKADYPKGYETALEKLAQWNTDDEWYEYVIDDAKRMGKILGITTDDIFFSGFWSQGDGACFVGTYNYRKGSCAAIREEAPEDKELHYIADRLFAIQRRNGFRLTAAIRKHSHHYSHENTVEVDTDTAARAEDEGDRGTLAEVLRDFMRWIYQQLKQEYEYRTSEEACIEMDAANEYRWTETGGF